MSEPLPLTAGQVRTARALLAWSQKDLATRADIAVSTVADFERGQPSRTSTTAEVIRKTLATAKICFASDGEVIGPTPRAIGQTTQSGTPLRWVNATDLAQWADRRDGQSSLPALLSKLIWAAGGAEPHFPADEGVQYSGWDGLTRASTSSAHIPAGTSGWEIGTQREGIRGKADEGYNNRTKQPLQLNPIASTFIFVTPRHCR